MAPFEKYRVPNLNFPIYNFDHSFDIEFYLELEYFVICKNVALTKIL